MGLFDYIRCSYPLPGGHADSGEFQTKDTPSQFMDHYEIREDGSLWHEDYDTEDRSDPRAEGVMSLAGMMTRVRKRWEKDESFTGEIRFYRGSCEEDWREFSAYYIKGTLQSLITIIEPVPREQK